MNEAIVEWFPVLVGEKHSEVTLTQEETDCECFHSNAVPHEQSVHLNPRMLL